MMMMNANVASEQPGLHARTSSHSQEPPTQIINVDEFMGNNNNNVNKKKKILMMEESTTYHAKDMDRTHVQLETWYSRRHKNMLIM
jgi:hypothetical protein